MLSTRGPCAGAFRTFTRAYHRSPQAKRGAGKSWHSAGRTMRQAKDGDDGFPLKKVMPLRTNRNVNYVPKNAKKSSSSWIFKDRFTNTAIMREIKNGDKPWRLTEEEYRAIKRADLRVPMRERALSAKQMIHQLRVEELHKSKKDYPRTIPDFKAGDRISITRYVELGKDNKFEILKGMCIARKNNMNESHFSILNNKSDTTYEMKIPLWSPFIKKIDILQKGTIKTRKAYYLRDRPVEEFLTR